MMTQQEIFDKVALHLLRQGKRATYDGESFICRYRAFDGTSCAIGCLIEDKWYSSGLEGCSIYARDIQGALKLSGILADDGTIRSLLGSLQYLHDGIDPSSWREELFAIANRYNLSPEVMIP
jgi:hypothetical protein